MQEHKVKFSQNVEHFVISWKTKENQAHLATPTFEFGNILTCTWVFKTNWELREIKTFKEIKDLLSLFKDFKVFFFFSFF